MKIYYDNYTQNFACFCYDSYAKIELSFYNLSLSANNYNDIFLNYNIGF